MKNHEPYRVDFLGRISPECRSSARRSPRNKPNLVTITAEMPANANGMLSTSCDLATVVSRAFSRTASSPLDRSRPGLLDEARVDAGETDSRHLGPYF